VYISSDDNFAVVRIDSPVEVAAEFSRAFGHVDMDYWFKSHDWLEGC
jgi:hypothetical protein